jgi:anti-sigma factor ChrR (cupin superfamily)
MNHGHPGFLFPRENMTPQEIEEAAAHLVECEECGARMRGLTAVFTEADVAATSIAPSPDLKKRILASIATAPRLEAYVEASAQLLDVPPARARDYLWMVDDTARWRPTPFEGVDTLKVKGGPSTADAFSVFIRVRAGASLPEHDHLGPENGLVLQGRVRNREGQVYGPGDRVDMEGGSRHELFAMPIIDCIFLAILHIGVRFGDFEVLANVLS